MINDDKIMRRIIGVFASLHAHVMLTAAALSRNDIIAANHNK
jgi:hypothetical protein